MRLVHEVKLALGAGSGSNSGSLKELDKKKLKKVEDAEDRKVDNTKSIKEWLCNTNENYQ